MLSADILQQIEQLIESETSRENLRTFFTEGQLEWLVMNVDPKWIRHLSGLKEEDTAHAEFDSLVSLTVLELSPKEVDSILHALNDKAIAWMLGKFKTEWIKQIACMGKEAAIYRYKLLADLIDAKFSSDQIEIMINKGLHFDEPPEYNQLRFMRKLYRENRIES